MQRVRHVLRHLALALRRARPGTSLHLIVDSTGLSIVGEGAWAAATHGGRGRRGWRKLHLGVDGSRVIVACALTEPTADDAITGIRLVDEVDGHLTRVTADPAYDTLACYGGHCQLVEGSALLPREIDAPDRSQQGYCLGDGADEVGSAAARRSCSVRNTASAIT